MAAPLPSPTMTSFLTVKEASQLSGKSPSSVRRIIYPIIHDDAHADRGHIEPSPEEVMKLRVKGENFAWRLSEELLRREMAAEVRPDQGFTGGAGKFQNDAQAELLSMLRRELDIKNTQITQQAELISKQVELVTGLSERLREGNMLMGSLQQRLALAEAKPTVEAQEIEVKRASSPPPKKGSTMPAKPAKTKRSLFFRLFRK